MYIEYIQSTKQFLLAIFGKKDIHKKIDKGTLKWYNFNGKK